MMQRLQHLGGWVHAEPQKNDEGSCLWKHMEIIKRQTIHTCVYIYTKNMCSYHAWYIRAMDSLAKKSNVTYHKAGFPFRSTRPKTPATFRTRVRAFRMGRLCPTCVRPRCSFQRFWGTSGRQDATWHHIIQQGVPLLYSWKCRWNSIFQKYFHILNWIKDRTIKS
jgi:hypothetical protein